VPPSHTIAGKGYTDTATGPQLTLEGRMTDHKGSHP
jgi:hypothetical protein